MNGIIFIIILSILNNNTMHLRYTIVNGKRVYTLKHKTDQGQNTLNAHPGKLKPPRWRLTTFLARFSPDDKFSMERMKIKLRYGLLQLDPNNKKK